MPILPEPFHSYGGHSSSPVRQWSSLVGILTAIIGNILISFALNTQRYAHIRIDREYKDKQDPEANKARKELPKNIHNYGAAVRQEEIAEERARINENASHPNDDAQEAQDQLQINGKQHCSDHDSGSQNDTENDDNDDDEENGGEGRKSYLKSPWWWLGITLMTIGEAGNFLAYAFAPASIVSPLGVVALISNCLIAPLVLKERFRQRDLWGVLVAIGGAVTVVFSAKTQEKKLGPDELLEDIKRWEFLVYILVTVVLMCALMFASPRYGRRTILIDLGLVGLFGGYTALSTKGVASLLSTSLYIAFTYPIFYVLILILVLSAVLQIRYLNRALQNFDSTQVIPVQFVLFTLSVIMGSAVLYRDFERTDVDHVIKFVLGCLLTFGGVYLITSGRKRENDDDDDESTAEDGERIHLLDEEAAEEPASPIKHEHEHEHEQTLKVDTRETQVDGPKTPKGDRSPSSSFIPSIAVTPAASAEHLDTNPWTLSEDRLDQTLNEQNSPARPHTPINQTIPSASSSETPQTAFYTPQTTKPLQQQPSSMRFSRTISSPAQPETPTRRAPSPPKPSLAAEDASAPFLQRQSRHSITRLIPGPILQPLSSSLSGIVADRILKGEGTPSPRTTLRRHRSNREATPRLASGLPNAPASASEISLQRAHTTHNASTEDSPLLARRGHNSDDETLGGTFLGVQQRPKGRLRSMSESLANFMSRATTGRRASKDDDQAGNSGNRSAASAAEDRDG